MRATRGMLVVTACACGQPSSVAGARIPLRMSDLGYGDRGGVVFGRATRAARAPDHPRGCHEARVFFSALGIAQADWRYLRDQLVDAVVAAPVRGTRITPFGVLYDIVVHVDGLNGSTHPVATVWLVADEDVPREQLSVVLDDGIRVAGRSARSGFSGSRACRRATGRGTRPDPGGRRPRRGWSPRRGRRSRGLGQARAAWMVAAAKRSQPAVDFAGAQVEVEGVDRGGGAVWGRHRAA